MTEWVLKVVCGRHVAAIDRYATLCDKTSLTCMEFGAVKEFTGHMHSEFYFIRYSYIIEIFVRVHWLLVILHVP